MQQGDLRCAGCDRSTTRVDSVRFEGGVACESCVRDLAACAVGSRRGELWRSGLAEPYSVRDDECERSMVQTVGLAEEAQAHLDRVIAYLEMGLALDAVSEAGEVLLCNGCTPGLARAALRLLVSEAVARYDAETLLRAASPRRVLH